MQDYYAVLEIDRGTSQEEVWEAYQARLREYAPSPLLGRKLRQLAEEETQRIHEAYAALSDPERRMQYHAEFSQHELQNTVQQDSPDILRYIQDQATIYNERAIEFFRQTRLEDAIAEWQKAVEITPEVAELHHNLGNAFAKQGELRQAVDAWERAVQLDPNLAEAYNNLGYAYYKLGDNHEARACWEQAINVKPGCAEAKRNLRLLQQDGPPPEQAGTIFEDVQEGQTSPPATASELPTHSRRRIRSWLTRWRTS